ncbi:MAG TPA: choice-of-anchor tandem repeat GloVer-containing protein [Terriglobales bacterium]
MRRSFLCFPVALCLVVWIAQPIASASATEKVIYSFQGGSDGAHPISDLIEDANGNLYGTTNDEGGGCGTVFELQRTSNGWSHKILYVFRCNSSRGFPITGLVMDNEGRLYGTTPGDYGDPGSVFELAEVNGVWQESVLYNFTAGSDGKNPSADLVIHQDNLYGTTYYAGGGSAVCNFGCGAVFELARGPNGEWKEKTIYDFAGSPDGSHPSTPLVFDADGNAYGMTTFGGGSGYSCSAKGDCGTVYKLTPGKNGTWTESVLYSFSRGDRSGIFPSGGPVLSQSGSVLGVDSAGGDGFGTVFMFERTQHGGWQTNLHIFYGGADGNEPVGRVARDADGNIYGVTSGAQLSQRNHGTVYELRSVAEGWREVVLHSFGKKGDGAMPQAGVVVDSSHHIYGTTERGGTGKCGGGCGTVYEIVP